MEDTPTSDSIHNVRRLTMRPPVYILLSRDISTCAPHSLLVWVGEIADHRRLENKGFLVACRDWDGLIGDLSAGDRGWPAVASGDLR